ncbi:MAG: carbonate dehydratase [Ignavibacteriaceae bacterium]
MKILSQLFDNNKKWADTLRKTRPDFFEKLSNQQNPEYLWIGCSDSRVPANEIVGLLPGELFVHRNVSNLVIHSDMNCLSVMQFAVEELKVKHIIVCGHYDCGGVRAAMEDEPHGLIDNWLRYIKEIYYKNKEELDSYKVLTDRVNRLCELNVVQQVVNVCSSTIVQEAWRKKQQLSVHGWIYGINDGLLKDLNVTIKSPEELIVIR